MSIEFDINNFFEELVSKCDSTHTFDVDVKFINLLKVKDKLNEIIKEKDAKSKTISSPFEYFKDFNIYQKNINVFIDTLDFNDLAKIRVILGDVEIEIYSNKLHLSYVITNHLETVYKYDINKSNCEDLFVILYCSKKNNDTMVIQNLKSRLNRIFCNRLKFSKYSEFNRDKLDGYIE